MPGLSIEERKRRAQRPPEIEREPPLKRMSGKKRNREELIQALFDFEREHHHCCVPLRYAKDRALGQFVVKTRKLQGANLTSDQKRAITKLGFDWETRKEKDDRRWHEMLKRLKDYKVEHGDCCVPQYWIGDLSLANWVSSQREKEANQKLPPEYKRKLVEIGFTWRQRTLERDPTTEDKKWFKKYRMLEKFHKKHGHCFVHPKDENGKVVEDLKVLANWVEKQREGYKAGKLKDERRGLLEELSFAWKVDAADPEASLTQAHWEIMFQHLVDFKEKFGHVEVNRHYSKWGLGNWVSVQRTEGRKGKLDPRRAKKLLVLGVTWGKTWDDRWVEGFQMLVKFHQRHGHCRVAKSRSRGKRLRKASNRRLANWMENQKLFRESGVLQPEREKLLNEIGFLWKGEAHRDKHLPSNEFYSSEDSSDSAEESDNPNGAPEPISKRRLVRRKLQPNPSQVSRSTSASTESDSSDSEFEFDDGGDVLGIPKPDSAPSSTCKI